MNYIIFSAQYLPTVGGVERYTNSLAKELIKCGHSVTVVTSALSEVPLHETDADGIQIFRLPCIMLMNGRFPLIKPSKQKSDFENWFKHSTPDFCVIQTRFYINSIYASYLCKKHSVPSIAIDHSTSHLMGGGIIGKIGDMYEHFAAHYIKKRTKGFYGVSKQCANWLRHFGINDAGVLYNCANLEAIEKITPASKSDYNCADQETLIVFAARLIPEKGVLKLIDAFNALPHSTNAKLVIAGTGALLEDVKQKATDRITVTGALPFEKVIALYKAADVFCLPTDYPEGFPTTVLEAAACKAMLVATDKGGTAEVISNDSFGILIKDNTVENLAAALYKAISDTEYRSSCIENSHKKVMQTFTWQNTCKNLLSITEKLI
ncbi:MAG: glycosyltransferase family 4 protein [Oscillospiraceae bacterium]|nr:glycosyltransferase family 4 protein [Oscillospiraceae bacterium]